MLQAFFEYDPQVTGTKGLVYIGDKLLVYRRDDKTDVFPLVLDLPGGGHEGQESSFETFQREVREEFGLEIRPEDIVYVRKYRSILDTAKHTYFPVAKLPESAKEQIRFGDEGMEYMLITPEEYLAAEVAWPQLKERVQEYLKIASAP